ncbi:MAG: hypothetical protein ACO36I_04160 [Candidatus Latescibacterota bacterium]
MHKLKHVLILYFSLLTTSVLAIGVGEPVDSFRLVDLEGTFHSDTDYRGKVIILAVIGYN